MSEETPYAPPLEDPITPRLGRTRTVLFGVWASLLLVLDMLMSVALARPTAVTGAEAVGHRFGTMLAPLIFALFVYAVAAIWKRNRTISRFVRWMAWVLFVLLLSQVAQFGNRPFFQVKPGPSKKSAY